MPRPPSPFDYNSDDYESQVLAKWCYRHALAHANHFPVEDTHIEQPDVSALLLSHPLFDILLGRIWVLMKHLLTKMIRQLRV